MEEKNGVTNPENTEKKFKSVNDNPGQTKRKSLVRIFKDSLHHEDIEDVAEYLIGDILVPSLLDMVSRFGKNAIDMFIYGRIRDGYDTPGRYSTRSTNSYGSYYRQGERAREEARNHRTMDYRDVIFETIGKAQLALDEMHRALEEYDNVTVGDLYDLANYPVSQVDYTYGWTDLRGTRVVKLSLNPNDDRAYIDGLPRPIPVRNR